MKVQQQEQKEQALRLQQLEERRRLQEAELRRVEEEKERALGLQRKERQLRQRLLSILLSKKADGPQAQDDLGVAHADLLRPVLDILQTVSAGCLRAASPHLLGAPPAPSAPEEAPPRPDPECAPRSMNGNAAEDAQCRDRQPSRPVAPDDASPEKRCPAVLSCIPNNNQHPKGVPPACEQSAPRKDTHSEQDKCNREPSKSRGRTGGDQGSEDRHKRERSRPGRAGSPEDRRHRKERRSHKKRSHQRDSPQRSVSPAHARSRRSHSRERSGHREKSRDRRSGSGRKHSRHRHGQRSRSGSPGRHRSTWDR